MTRPHALLIGCLCLALVTMVGAAPATQPSDVEKENAELRNRVAALEAQVKSLEDQVARLKQRERSLVIPRLPQVPSLPYRFDRVPQPAPSQPSPQVPTPQQPGREWIPKQFDGRTFYIVPCAPPNDGAPVAR